MAHLNNTTKTNDSCLLKAEFHLCVTEKQNEVLFQWAGGCRAMWNFFLAETKASYADNQITRNFDFIMKMLKI